MRKLLLAILGLFPNYVIMKDGEKIPFDGTKADILKESYYKNADKHNCFCGGRFVIQQKNPSPIAFVKIKICNECGTTHYHFTNND